MNDKAGPGRRIRKLSPAQIAVGRHMAASASSIPQFDSSTQIDMAACLSALEAAPGDAGGRQTITVTAALVYAIARTLTEHPNLNAVWNGDSLEVVDDVNISIAIAREGALVAPAIQACQRLGLLETSSALRDLVERARLGRVRTGELTEGTFTLSNLGRFAVHSFTSLVSLPQIAALAVGRITSTPLIQSGGVISRPILFGTLSADHRAVNGADAGAFLTDLKARIESPGTWVRALG